MLYFVKTPKIITQVFSNLTWNLPTKEKVVYLTFDDGPTPDITQWVLEQLKKYNAKATFFCIGKNIVNHSDIFHEIINNGHAIGNHTHNHLNAWKTDVNNYMTNINQAEEEILRHHFNKPKKLFRPPYGKISLKSTKQLLKKGYKIIMWDILSADFDQKIAKEKCLKNVLENIDKGSIIVFHDSVKAFENLKYVLPKVLEKLHQEQYLFKAL